ncbi:hypothetical protein JMUB7554_27600 [Staphylococcus aureus]
MVAVSLKNDIHIIVIRARQEEQTIIQALDNGANDYLSIIHI